MALSSIELCSSALIKLGADGISSFEDGTAEARVAARLYPSHATRCCALIPGRSPRHRPSSPA